MQTFTFEGEPDAVALGTLWFEDLGDGRTRLRTQLLCDSFEGRDAWLRSGMETGYLPDEPCSTGWPPNCHALAMDRLARLLAGAAGPELDPGHDGDDHQ